MDTFLGIIGELGVLGSVGLLLWGLVLCAMPQFGDGSHRPSARTRERGRRAVVVPEVPTGTRA